MRKILRQMAKARMKAMRIERVNRRMSEFWRQALTDPEAEKALMKHGQEKKLRKDADKVNAHTERMLRKVAKA